MNRTRVRGAKVRGAEVRGAGAQSPVRGASSDGTLRAAFIKKRAERLRSYLSEPQDAGAEKWARSQPYQVGDWGPTVLTGQVCGGPSFP
jgi:hypothetical protein